MMSSLGSKRNIKIFSLALAGVFISSIGGSADVHECKQHHSEF